MNPSISPSTLNFLIDHVALPSKLPQRREVNSRVGEIALSAWSLQSCRAFRETIDVASYHQWSKICSMISQFKQLHSTGNLQKASLKTALREISEGDTLLLQIVAQNAGLIIRKVKNNYHVEAFEASARAADVLASGKALKWDFPSRAVAVPDTVFEDPRFQDELAEFLEKASLENIKQLAAMTLKASTFAFESRDTTDPALITEMLMALLEAVGHLHSPEITRKRIRDDVCWSDGAETPWRRSPVWLVLRVGLQRTLCFLLGGNIGLVHYKFYMVFFLQSLGIAASQSNECTSDRIALLEAKLARRFAKLQSEREHAPNSLQSTFNTMFESFDKPIVNCLQSIKEVLSKRWSTIQDHARKRVPRLPLRADPQALILSLTHSGDYLQKICQQKLQSSFVTSVELTGSSRSMLSHSSWSKLEFSPGLDLHMYMQLADFEQLVQHGLNEFEGPQSNLNKHCVDLARNMESYKAAASSAYSSNPEQLSYMTLTIMQIWIDLDRAVLQMLPLLAQYPIDFPDDILHSLQIVRLVDMERLQSIEKYLQNRRAKSDSSLPSIFTKTSKDCFAEKHFDQCDDMQALHIRIEFLAGVRQAAKHQEWVEKSAEYERLLNTSRGMTCMYMEDPLDSFLKLHDDRGCQKCYLNRRARRLRIRVHEHPLPSDLTLAKAVVFELLAPSAFVVWRDTTWAILRDLGRQRQTTDVNPNAFLHDYSELKPHVQLPRPALTLASNTKSFLSTHYADVSFPTTIDNVCLPSGLKYELFDHQAKLWTARQTQKPSFADLCSPSLPSSSAFSSLEFCLHPVIDPADLTANKVMANQTKCPGALTVLEYNAFQELRLGSNLQWPRLLRELVSSNMNFALEASSTLVSQLALQAGPPRADNPLRAAHWVFEDAEFCKVLSSQIRRRLEASVANWRESHSVDCLVTILLRMWSLASCCSSIAEAEGLIRNVRDMSFNWAKQLRLEVLTNVDGEIALKRSGDATFAALLCRKTFAMEAEHESKPLTAEAMSCFIECSMILKENMPGELLKMPARLRRRLVYDMKLVHALEPKIRSCLPTCSEALDRAVNSVWPEPEDSARRSFTSWVFLVQPYHHWISAQTIPTDRLLEQTVHYNIMSGEMLVNGQPLGKLPPEYINQQSFQQLFGDRPCWTYPSSLPGMSYMAATLVEGRQVHFGFREGRSFIRIRDGPKLFEHIPRHVFTGADRNVAADFPRPLIDSCVHWLDVVTGVLEIRPIADMWKPKFSNWSLDLKTRQATRRKRSSLVDTRSPIFQIIGAIIEPFEYRARMILYQPQNGTLSLRLPELEVAFEVNDAGLLRSRQLRAVIDSNQDPGTLYGLGSKLVLRDVVNPQDRSILVTLGTPNIQRFGEHVNVIVTRPVFYCRFPINKILSRLECPAEPRLIYLKAYYHAVTSSVLPDPLTGRTGTEEALHCLTSGLAQPWSPFDPDTHQILARISALTPRRVYYPEEMKVMQKIIWNDHLSPAVQHDDFRPAIDRIMVQHTQLHRFYVNLPELPHLESCGVTHLLRRARERNKAYRPAQSSAEISLLDNSYGARDRGTSLRYNNVFESATLTKQWSRHINVIKDLAGTLQQWPTIQGYNQPLDITLLNDLINMDIPMHWGSLFDVCKKSTGIDDRFRFMFFFAAMSFNKQVNMEIIRTLISFTILQDFKGMVGPSWPLYTGFREGQKPTMDFLMNAMNASRLPYPGDERDSLGVYLGINQRRKLAMVQERHEVKSKESCKTLACHFLSQWPCTKPHSIGCESLPLIDLERALLAVAPEWEYCFHSHDLSQFLKSLQKILNTCEATGKTPLPSIANEERAIFPTPCSSKTIPTLQDLLKGADLSALQLSHNPVQDRFLISKPISSEMKNKVKPEVIELERIVAPLRDSSNAVRRRYGLDLQQSIEGLREFHQTKIDYSLAVDPAQLTAAITECRKEVQEQFDSICRILSHHNRFSYLSVGALWPRVTPVTLLETLRSCTASQGIQHAAVVQYGVLITQLQRLLRVAAAKEQGNRAQLIEELGNTGYTSWSPHKYPDWLLLQIEFNLLIRPDQYEVAMAMMSPSSNANSVLQMNMGQGKSSVIIPMIAASLADRKRLLRVIVPKALLIQMAQLLQARLGGLVGRLVKHVPFSRKSSTESANIKAYFDLHKEVLASGGVILALPEHLLSFRLSGLQCLSSGRMSQAIPMMNVQAWLAKKSRDILDECDHTLAVKTQLIYPSGAQSIVDGNPNRWKIVQAVLQLVKYHLPQLKKEYPRGLEVVERPGSGFPAICILRTLVKDALVKKIAGSICSGQGSLLPVKDCSKDELDTVSALLREAKLSKNTARKSLTLFEDRPNVRRDVLLLRGLLVHRILLMGLNKRWNVQYGLHPGRDPIAVPFHAKGVPSDQAEFGHPDVAILLTCLSFYYSGLTLSQLQQSLKQLPKSDDPSLDYNRMIRQSSSIPSMLRTWTAVNVDDEVQCKELWYYLSHNMAAVDYFLNNFVFPRHAKTFQRKLVSSGWDIPLFRPLDHAGPLVGGKENEPPKIGTKGNQSHANVLSTGFSGTNDNKTLLPLTIQQQDLPALSHTNAEVITYLLQPRNREYVLAASEGRRLTEYQLLQRCCNRRIRVLIDAGAQILELDNRGLAASWLQVDTEAVAAIYFGSDDKPRVLYRDGHYLPLAASPFLDNYGECLVYLDESHTRGTDLKLPTDAVAALTLGPNQTKDHTVQAAMRLRQLGTSQSVIYFAPPEVHQSILDVRNLHGNTQEGSRIDSFDVVRWLLEQTCCGIEQVQPLYISQGLDFCRRSLAAIENVEAASDAEQRASYLKVLEQPENYTLEQLYAPKKAMTTVDMSASSSPEIAGYIKQLYKMREDLRDTSDTVQALAHQEVEQEREVQVEVETVREVQKPYHATASRQLGLQRDVLSFAEHGNFVAGGQSYQQAFLALRQTAVGMKLGINDSATQSKLFVTSEFSNTIVLPSGLPMDEYQRPVSFILWSPSSATALILSPFEAEELLPLVRNAKTPCTHLVTYAAPVTRSMLEFNNLNMYSIPSLPEDWAPSWLIRDLGIFAGRLYFDAAEYPTLCQFLGVALSEGAGVGDIAESSSPEQGVDGTSTEQRIQPFCAKPLVFMQEWLTVRRKGQDFSQTPMGLVCRGRKLELETISSVPTESAPKE